MPTAKTRSHKHFRLNGAKIKRAQKLCAGTETKATERFVKSAIAVKDIYSTLEP